MRLILIAKKDTDVRSCEVTSDLFYAAEFMELSVSELGGMLEKHGRVDTDECICIPFDP